MTKPLCIIHIEDDTPTSDIVDEIKDALIALNAPLRLHNDKLCWRVGEQLIPMTTTRLVYETSKIGIRFERCNAKGRWEPSAAPKKALQLFLQLAEQRTWWVDEWDDDESEFPPDER
jgi:hypothetical protein